MKSIIEKENKINRWMNELSHHPETIALIDFICEIDTHVYNKWFDFDGARFWEDKDVLMYMLDAFFEAKDAGDIPK